MTGQTPPRTAAFTATVRVHLLHAPDPDTEPNPDLEAAAIREGVVFALPPHKGDTFIPGQLSQALLNAQLTPIVDHIAHAPALPSDDRYDQGGYAEVVVTCTSRDVPSDHLLEQLRNEGWKVHDFRAQARRRRDGKTF